MSDWNRSLVGRKQGSGRRSRRRAGFAGAALAMVAVGVTALTPAASAAQVRASVAPDPLTVCNGGITADSSGVNQLDYAFSCAPLTTANGQNGNILTFTVEAIRPQDDLNNIQNFDSPDVVYALDNPNAVGYSPTATGPSTTIDPLAPTLLCQGGAGNGIDGIDCYQSTSSSSTADAYVPSGDYVEGDLNLDEPYCSYLPEGAKPGTPAVPQAEIELVVTDSTGAEDGPFELDLPQACPNVPAVVPAFTLASVKSAGKSVTVTSNLPFTGKLAVKLTDGRTIVGSATETVRAAGKASVKTTLNSTGARLLTKAGKAGISVAVTATYTPTDGKSETASRSGVTVK